jgi:hypothetical protein
LEGDKRFFFVNSSMMSAKYISDGLQRSANVMESAQRCDGQWENRVTDTLMVVLNRISALEVMFTRSNTMTPLPPAVVVLTADGATDLWPGPPATEDSNDDVDPEARLMGALAT